MLPARIPENPARAALRKGMSSVTKQGGESYIEYIYVYIYICKYIYIWISSESEQPSQSENTKDDK